VRRAGLHESARVRRAIWSVDRRCRGIGFTDNTDPKNIWVQPIDGGAPHPLTTFTDKTINDVVWSHDGKRLAITRGASLADIVLLKGIR
jgi:dipeptidyl aminopeptidase/acylaminoacyl peptidase